MTRADLEKDPRDVATMFDEMAKQYDLLNDVLTAGLDRRWRRIVAGEVGARRGEVVLDLAAGTGTSSVALAEGGASVVACDFSLGMLDVGARRRGGASQGGVTCVGGDALHLPFADEVFDAVTISFGLRNVFDTEAAMAELLRTTKPGGRVLVCELSHLRPRSLDAVYSKSVLLGIPLVARFISDNPQAYEYLPASIKDWPDQPRLAATMQGAGWERVAWRNLLFGVVALHRGYRPAP